MYYLFEYADNTGVLFSPSNTTTAEGNGAELLPSPNLKRPFTRRISLAFMQYSCQNLVSVLDGINATTVVFGDFDSS